MFESIDIAQVAMQYFCLLLSLCVHEASHAAMANRCGDPSARLLGRMSLNPLVHIDVVGTVVMPLLMMLTPIRFLIGWAKPVPVNPLNLKNMRRDQVLVALAGPGSNLVLAFVSAMVLRIAIMLMGGESAPGAESAAPIFASTFLYMMFMLMMINIALMVFNLLPVPPLDGGHVLRYFLPPNGQRVLDRFGQFGLLFIIFFGRELIAVPMEQMWRLAIWFIGI